jgi:hypothetical protein
MESRSRHGRELIRLMAIAGRLDWDEMSAAYGVLMAGD